MEYDGEGVAEITKRFLAMGVVVHVSINNILPGTPNAAVENISHYTVITTSINIMSFKQKVIKRLMDIGVSIIGIAITAILFVIFAPIIFIQSRVQSFSNRNVLERMEDGLRFINSDLCIWMQKNGRKSLWHRIKCPV